MASSSNASKKQNPSQRRLRRFIPLLSNNANRAASAAANPAKPQIAIPKTSASLAPDQLSPKPVAVLPTTHPPSANLVPADAASRHILNKVLEQLEEKDKRVINAVTSSDDEISSVLSAVYAACKEKKELCEKKGWTFTLRGRTVKLREQADKVIFWLDKFKQVGDVAANADPMHVALPWAAIRFLLEVCKFVVYFAIVRNCTTIF
jgi:hypothetical protein